jgi:hypothetical protein
MRFATKLCNSGCTWAVFHDVCLRLPSEQIGGWLCMDRPDDGLEQVFRPARDVFSRDRILALWP